MHTHDPNLHHPKGELVCVFVRNRGSGLGCDGCKKAATTGCEKVFEAIKYHTGGEQARVGGQGAKTETGLFWQRTEHLGSAQVIVEMGEKSMMDWV